MLTTKKKLLRKFVNEKVILNNSNQISWNKQKSRKKRFNVF